ncbi:MFS transporter [Microbacterium sp. W4I20]|uniref:MFS transporter n=1 Tax=Microbacterium sp. W4I20 TaxID=3042262 RepID=UPI00277E7B20|nr:MFS transporter [Microbacterium sp. W4I20]MDQ0727659.1 MHS family proline/betaine transporter-like MFS transporter [Microbacterium sp. W4I20]
MSTTGTPPSEADTAPPTGSRPKVTAVTAALLGNVMEYFDFVAYGLVAVVIGSLFFPNETPALSLLASLATFGVAFLFRPIGAAFFGSLGDRRGRRIALSLSILVMGISTAMIGLLPTYATVGILAPILLVLARCIQGFSVGGEFAGAATFIVENAPAKRRGFWSSWLSMSSSVGTILASLVVLTLRSTLPAEQFEAWGWRVPFLMALPLALIGLYLRRRTEETAAFKELVRAEKVAKSPIRTLFRENPRAIILAIALASMTGITFYYFNTYFINYLVATVELDATQATFIALSAQLVYAPMCLVVGLFSDRFGRRWIILGAVIGLAVLAVPIFLLLSSHNLLLAFFGLAIFAVLAASLSVSVTVTQTELFPAEIRMTGVALGNNLGTALVGGTSPFVAAALVTATGTAIAPSFYLIAVSAVMFVVIVIMLPETLRRSTTAR